MSEIHINIFDGSCDDESSHRHRKHRAAKLGFEYSICGAKFKGENIMTTLQPGQSVSVKVNPLKADGSPSLAVLSSVQFSSSDITVFTFASDPTDPTGASGTITAVALADAQATISASATAAEPDGVTAETISGSDTVFVSAVTPPPGVATSLGFTYGTPTPAAAAKGK